MHSQYGRSPHPGDDERSGQGWHPGGSPWSTAPGSPPPVAPTTGGTYGRASVPLNTVGPDGAQKEKEPWVAGPSSPAVGGEVPAGAVTPPRMPAVRPVASGHEQPGVPAAGQRRASVASRKPVIASVAAVLVLVLGVGVAALVRPGPIKNLLAGGSTPSPARATLAPDPEPTPVLVAASGGTQPDPARIKVALDPLVSSAALGTTVHAAVLDVASGQVLYARDADVPTTPASTTKLLTAATVLASRGPGYRIGTTAVAGREPGEVVLVGGGDPTLSVDGNQLFPGAARLDRLAGQVKKALGATPVTSVAIDTSLFSGPETGTGWASDDISPLGQVARIQPLMTNGGRIKPIHNEHGGDPRFADPALSAGKAFAKLLGAPAASVKRDKAPEAPAASAPASAAAAPIAPGTRLGLVQSAPLVQITDWMLEQSDNTLAEVMARQVALANGKPATFDGATDAIIAKLRQMGLPGDEADLYDGSGLSRHNGISPTLLTQVLALAASGKLPEITGMLGGLPVAGWSGTLADRFVSPRPNQVGQGVVRAKTGTLSGVNTMAGQLVTKDGRLLVFAIMASGSANAFTAKAALDKVPARLVTCGC
ncbi:D-alanyl-D-alanine carboxypeptidase/D-alanyl-D-alanine endopeptidase [Actinoplanes sp. CA-030573]|uniref:D-alanyl-D-alanine carboxypeptidase/D-alanyl-D-alanine endopeptidase n=1 Tax=Actinoplanes sp. CA-030573 TaxID=3239898 RepID=UPI003D91B718